MFLLEHIQNGQVRGHSYEETAPVLSRSPLLSLGLWVQHKLSLLQGPILGVTGRRDWGMALSSVP